MSIKIEKNRSTETADMQLKKVSGRACLSYSAFKSLQPSSNFEKTVNLVMIYVVRKVDG